MSVQLVFRSNTSAPPTLVLIIVSPSPGVIYLV